MATSTIRVKGLDELRRSFNRLDRRLTRDLGEELKRAAVPVAERARERVSRYRGASPQTIQPTRSGLRVYVRQGARKVTGRRGDFGHLQMIEVLEPALEERSDEVVELVDDVLGRWGGDAGF